MPDSLRVRVWCEDREHESFTRALLDKLGIERRDVTVFIAPGGKGSASKWVMDQYPEIRRQDRATKHQKRLGFLMLLDGDNVGVESRMKQLHQERNRDPTERTAILVPTWEIETWVLWLNNVDVDERQSHKSTIDARRFREMLPSAVNAWSMPRPNEGTNIPSLAKGRQELQKLSL